LVNGKRNIGHGDQNIWKITRGYEMSYFDYEKAMELAKNRKFYTTINGKSQDDIDISEKILNIKFSKEIKDFYLKYGYLSFEGNEIFGINPTDDSGILEGNSVAYALNERKQYGMPEEWLPFYNFGEGYLACQDYLTKNQEGEPRIISVFYDGEKYMLDDVVADDFGEFVLGLLE
jgi:hypothetical protein